MAGSSKRQSRESKRRLEIMEAKRQLRQSQGKRRLRDNLIAIVAAAVLLAAAIVLDVAIFSHNPSSADMSSAEKGLATPTPLPSDSPSATPTVSMPAVPPASAAAGKTYSGTLTLNTQPIGVQLDGAKAPQATAAFVALAGAKYFDGKPCHRVTTGADFAVLQCGALNMDGASAPNFSWGPIENAPSNNIYPAGTIAVARASNNAQSQGTQFFITYRDTKIPADSAGGYTVVGKVTSGLDVVSAIGAVGVQGGGSDGQPAQPVTVNSFTLKQD